MNTDYMFRMSQDDLKYIFETAAARMESNPAFAEMQERIIKDYPFFKSEKEALIKAFELERKTPDRYQIWAKIEKSGEVFRVVNWWIVSDDWKVLKAAEYIGMAQMYDTSRLNRLLADNANVDAVVAYW